MSRPLPLSRLHPSGVLPRDVIASVGGELTADNGHPYRGGVEVERLLPSSKLGEKPSRPGAIAASSTRLALNPVDGPSSDDMWR
ncbi:unnamed protein product [Lasius platythorax]|uniref:Uncharacterized protein n=1 Tax=Lasius platythorax TaxID=488582 RepID=A0AAV2N1J5_9HYME